MMSEPLNSVERLRSELSGLATEAQARAEEFEQARNIPLDFVIKLKRAGVYGILVSKQHGGLGGTLCDWLDMAMTLAYADGSVGWTAGHGAVGNALIENIAGPAFVDEFFSDPMASAAWSNMPRVEVQEVANGLHLNGRWSFGTGCMTATHVGGMVQLPPEGGSTTPRFVVALVRQEDASIDPNWDPIGLAGTGSHDIVFSNITVPHSHIFEWPSWKADAHRPLSRFIGGTWFIAICAAATHLGLARRALDEARRELTGKLDRFTKRPTLEKPAILLPLEEAEGLLFACRAGLEKALDAVWQAGQRGETLDTGTRMQVRLAAVTAVHQGERIVRTAYDLAGASAVRRSGPLQRIYRDASCLTHHVSANRDSFEVIGRVRCGFDPLTFRV